MIDKFRSLISFEIAVPSPFNRFFLKAFLAGFRQSMCLPMTWRTQHLPPPSHIWMQPRCCPDRLQRCLAKKCFVEGPVVAKTLLWGGTTEWLDRYGGWWLKWSNWYNFVQTPNGFTSETIAMTFIPMVGLRPTSHRLGIYPAVDPLDSTSRMLDPSIVGQRHLT